MIRIENLNYTYQKDLPFSQAALKNINLEINQGELVAIIGHTGSGKSTLIQHLNGLIKASSGKIVVDGIDITDQKADLKKLRKNVGIVFQYPEYQLFEETVFKDIAFGPKNMGFSNEEIEKSVYDAIRAVNIGEELLEKSPFELSGGQKRRVAIAGVLAMNPRTLILDEPTAGLDPRGRDKILKLIQELHNENKERTIIFISHSMEDVARIAERVIVMNKGTIAMTGTVSEIFKHDHELVKMGLNVPQVTRLVKALENKGIRLGDDIFTIDKAYEAILDKIKEVKYGN